MKVFGKVTGICLILAVCCTFALSGCSTGKPVSKLLRLSGEPGGIVTGDQLPNLADLDVHARTSAITDEIKHKAQADQYFMRSANTTIERDDILFNTGADELAFVIFRFGQFKPEDSIYEMKTNAWNHNLENPEDFGFYLAIPDFTSGSWVIGERLTAEGKTAVQFPETDNISPAGFSYVAVLFYENQAALLSSLTTYWDLFEREAPLDPVDQILGAPPLNADIGELLEFTLQAADSTGALIPAFNAPGHLLAAPAGMVVLDDAGFTDGEALCQIRFVAAGVYQLSLENAHPQIDGPLANITVVERPVDQITGFTVTAASVDQTVEFSLEALDAEGFVIETFNETGVLTSDPAGLQISDDAEFAGGVANCSISFPAAGVYEITLGGSHSSFNIVLGSVTVTDDTPLTVQAYRITMSQDELDFMYQNLNNKGEEYAHGSLEIEGSDEGHVICRFLLGGVGSRPKKSWRIEWPGTHRYFDPQWGYEREKMELIACYTDATMLREPLSGDIMMESGILTSRVKPVRLYVNGDYWGIYSDIEHPREAWLDDFGIDSTGPLYKAHRGDNAGFEKDQEHPDWYSTYYRRYNKHTQRDKLDDDGNQDWSDLLELILDINDEPDVDFYDWADRNMDVNQLVKSMVFHSFISNTEQIYNNYAIYLDEQGSDKWIFIPYDQDMAWGRTKYGNNEYNTEIYTEVPVHLGREQHSGWSYGDYNVLMERFYRDPQLLQLWEDEMQVALDTYLSVDHLINRIDHWYGLVEPWAQQDSNKWEPWGFSYDERVELLRNFVRDRHAFVSDAVQ